MPPRVPPGGHTGFVLVEAGSVGAAAAGGEGVEELEGEGGGVPRRGRLPALDLLAAAAAGPVVVVAVSEFGTYALIVTATGVREPVMLAGLTPEVVYERVVRFLTALEDLRSASGPREVVAAEKRLADILGWLWDTVAGPVLDRLGITGPPGEGEPWPRLWWCPSGLLSFLPLHAAGHHGRPGSSASPCWRRRSGGSWPRSCALPTPAPAGGWRRGRPSTSSPAGDCSPPSPADDPLALSRASPCPPAARPWRETGHTSGLLVCTLSAASRRRHREDGDDTAPTTPST
jgi:hypothetical protein